MNSSPLPDHYLALGLAKDATSAQVKTSYRKLVLKFHPDKVLDESKKLAAADRFHRIQQAYEVLGDDHKRAKYNAALKLEQMRQEVLQRQQQQYTPRSQSTPYAYSPQAMSEQMPDFKVHVEKPRDPPVYPEPIKTTRPTAARFDEYEGAYTHRRHSHIEKEPRKTTPKTEEEKRAYVKGAEKSSRHDRKKTVDKDRRRERENKRPSPLIIEDDSESDDYPERSRKPNDGRSHRRGSDHEDEITMRMRYASEYIGLPPGTAQWAEIVMEPARRSSAKPRTKDRSSRRESEPQRHYSEGEVNYKHFDPLRRPRGERSGGERRSRTLNEDKPDRREMPTMQRAETMPTLPTRRPDGPSRGDSKLRQTAEMRHGLYTPGTSPPYDQPFAPPKSASKSKYYHIIDEDDEGRAVSPHTVDRRRYTESPSPVRGKSESKSRSSSRRSKPTVPPLYTSAESHYPGYFDTPHSAREPSSSMFVGYDIPRATRRGSLDRDRDRDRYEVPYTVRESKADKVYAESPRSSRRSSRASPAPLKRGYTFTGGFFSSR